MENVVGNVQNFIVGIGSRYFIDEKFRKMNFFLA